MALKLLATRKNLLVVFYEDIVENPIAEVRKMLNFLKFPIYGQRLQCLEKHVTGKYKSFKTEVNIALNYKQS